VLPPTADRVDRIGLSPAASHAVSTAVVRRVPASARSLAQLPCHQIYTLLVS
jgi:hypothetical protein